MAVPLWSKPGRLRTKLVMWAITWAITWVVTARKSWNISPGQQWWWSSCPRACGTDPTPWHALHIASLLLKFKFPYAGQVRISIKSFSLLLFRTSSKTFFAICQKTFWWLKGEDGHNSLCHLWITLEIRHLTSLVFMFIYILYLSGFVYAYILFCVLYLNLCLCWF